MDKIFSRDRLSKRERVQAALLRQPVDRVPLLEQLSYNPRVIELYTGRKIEGFDYTVDDICAVIRKTLDLAMLPVAPRGTEKITGPNGFVIQNDNWTSWRVSRPFDDAEGARKWLEARIDQIRATSLTAADERESYHKGMTDLQEKVGETVILNYSHTGFCYVYDSMGLEIFSYFQADFPEVLESFIELKTAREVARIHAVADPDLSPVILLAEDFATKQGPMFSPEFLRTFHYPYVRRVVEAWHGHDIRVLYHSDGNYGAAIPDLMDAGVDGFYCLEPNCGMDIVELKNTWPAMVWAGGVDGVDLLERGSPDAVRTEVRRHITETNALETGGMFVASSSEINPPIPAENFRAMVEAVGGMMAIG